MIIENYFSDLLSAAILKQSSDIYFLPKKDGYDVKLRFKNQVVISDRLSKLDGRKCLNYCKFQADMAISEHRRPQVGAMDWYVQNNCYSLRLSTVGDFNAAESLVIRIIYPLNRINQSTFLPEQLDQLVELTKQRGLIAFAGPTGSGKTTTIYHLAKKVAQEQLVMSIEDPVEIAESDFLQLQVNEAAGMGYSELIKVGLRHRPDVFLIGEIRDEITANAAIQAALSGHLVLATVHSQDPWGIIKRISQLGITQEYINQSVTGLVYQRLIPDIEGNSQSLMAIHHLKDSAAEPYQWEEWQQNLETMVDSNQITKETAKQFATG